MDQLSPGRYREVFDTGFAIARRSLFKLLREGPPDDWRTTGGEGH